MNTYKTYFKKLKYMYLIYILMINDDDCKLTPRFLNNAVKFADF